MKLNTFLLITIMCFIAQLKAQDVQSARSIISKLTSPEFDGRGYTNKGDSIAASYIANELKKRKVKPFNNNYFQEFSLSVNTFPKAMYVKLDTLELIPGYDYLVSSTSCSVNGTFPVITMNHQLIDYPEKLRALSREDIQKSFLLLDSTNYKNKGFKDALNDIINFNLFQAKGIIQVEYKKLMYGPAPFVQDFPKIILHRDAMPEKVDSISLSVENEYLENYTTRNIAAFVKGQIDTFLVFTAHYDHLGEMGKGVYFPGANDNASGTAMVLELAKYFAKNKKKLKYSMAFLFFSAEELGLLGSKYYVEHPVFPLSKIKFLVNLDMVGSGDNGIKVVNGTIFRSEFETLAALNKKNNFLPDVFIRGPAANSDHFPFYEKGVKSFFIYTMGEYSEYHSIFDREKDLPLIEYEDLFKLLVGFSGSL